MHQDMDILTKEQIELLPLIKSFSGDFFLAGGTAVALIKPFLSFIATTSFR
ncbi:MAG: hypothetical protein N3B18_01275 [Desulfobacterota bacterium]|nr:hypothetical protein [Thermodesulfobacteriota bacterium]